MKAEIGILLSVLSLSSFAVLPAVIGDDVTASLYVQDLCSLTVSPTSISFGTPKAGDVDVAADHSVNLKNYDQSSNIPANIYLEGTDWNLPNFDVGKTKYMYDVGTSTPLTTSAVLAGLLPVGEAGKDVSFTVSVPANQAAGSYSQKITVTFSCQPPA